MVPVAIDTAADTKRRSTLTDKIEKNKTKESKHCGWR